jgi:hypothetical protein
LLGCREALQQQEAALADVQAALAIEPNNKEAASKLQQLQPAQPAAEAQEGAAAAAAAAREGGA